MLDVKLNETEEMLRDAVRDVLREQVSPQALEQWEHSPEGLSNTLWETCGQLGWLSILDSDDGDGGNGLLHAGLVLMEIGASGLASPFFQSIAAQTLLRRFFATTAQSDIRSLATGKNQACVVRLLDGAAYSGIETPESLTLGAGRRLVEWGGDSDLFIVPVEVQNDLAIALVRRSAAGVTTENAHVTDNERAVWLALDGVRCPASDFCLVRRSEMEDAFLLIDLLRSALMSGGVSKMTDITSIYVAERSQFGRPLGSLQAVQHQCADMLMLADGARLAVLEALWRCVNGVAWMEEAACAVYFTAYAAEQVSQRAAQLHGGMGHIRDHVLHQYFRRARGHASRLGPIHQRLERIARLSLPTEPGQSVQLSPI